MFVIKATYKDETRRLSFQSSHLQPLASPAPATGFARSPYGCAAPQNKSQAFPVYGDVQQRVNVRSSATDCLASRCLWPSVHGRGLLDQCYPPSR